MSKRNDCRNYYKKLRDSLTPEAAAIKSEQICSQILISKEYKNAETIFAYYPLGKEVNCLRILEQALKEGKRVLLPRTEKEGQMDFYEISDWSDVEEGTFHVMEPKIDCRLFLPPIPEKDVWKEGCPAENMLVLVPGVVFDCKGNRYGYGKGYYDRYFARFPWLKRMAPAYTEQIAKSTLYCLETDIKMHVILTETERIDIMERYG